MPETGYALPVAIVLSPLKAVYPGESGHDHMGLLLELLHPCRLPVGQKLNHHPEGQGEDQQQGKKQQGPLLTTGQQVELSVKTFSHLRLDVANGH